MGRMPLSKKKNIVVHCGKEQLNHTYTLYDEVKVYINNIADIGIVRSTSTMYSGRYHSIASKAAKTANAIR